MKRRKILELGAVALSVLALGAGSIAAQPENPALAGLQRWLDGTRDLRARFEQELISGALGGGEVESGRLLLAKPGRMRWDYERPERKVAVLEGERTSLYVAADRQLWLGRLDAADRLLPSLLAADRPIVELFDVGAGEPDEAGRPTLRLVPRDGGDGVSEVLLSLTPDEFAIAGAVVLDGSGNRVRYRFSRLRRNRGVPDGAFDFDAPPGTDVIENP